MKSKKGVISIYISFMIIAIVIVIIASVLAPLGIVINTEFYKAGEDILNTANESIQGIQNDTVREQIQSSINTAFLAGQNNIDVNANIFQYGWVFVIGLSAVIIFIATRRIIEFGGSDFV